MKISPIVKILFLISSTLFFFSCNYSEYHYTLKEDGSGTIRVHAELNKHLLVNISEEISSHDMPPEDREFKNFFKMVNNAKDTMFSLKENFTSDPIAQVLEDWNMRIETNKKDDKLIGLQIDYANHEHLMKQVELLHSSVKLPFKKEEYENGLIVSNRSLKLSSKKIQTDIMILKGFKNHFMDDDTQQNSVESNYRMKYEVPGKIKKVIYNGDWEKVDQNTVVLNLSNADIVNVSDLTIKWK